MRLLALSLLSLAAFAQRLQSSLGAGMFCGRLVGDEFAIERLFRQAAEQCG